IGWSAGGMCVGSYAALHPEKVDRLVLYASSVFGAQPPPAGFAVTLQTRERLEEERWDSDLRWADQLDPGLREVLWQNIMQWDRVGASWLPDKGVMRVPLYTTDDWTPEVASKIMAPTLFMFGQFDNPERLKGFEQISTSDKVLMRVACGSHFMVWEKP